MKTIVFLSIVLFSLFNANLASAEHDTTLFKVLCSYEMQPNSPYGKHCRAAVKFIAPSDESDGPCCDKPSYPVKSFEITCDKNPHSNVDIPTYPIYNDGGTLYHELLGTIIMAEEGPMPAITLPRGTIHSGVHVADSNLHLNLDNAVIIGHGKCTISGQELAH